MKKLRDLLEKSTPGPIYPRASLFGTGNIQLHGERQKCIGTSTSFEDAELIVALRNCAEELIAVVEAAYDQSRSGTYPRLDMALEALERKVESLNV